MQENTRINKFIAGAIDISRRKADELILDGKVKVNGKILKEPGLTVTSKDKIEVNGKPLIQMPKKYVRFYKPPGYLTTKSDPDGRKTIYEFLQPDMKHLRPVGRLDKATSGLLILTNDGELIQQLTHPKYPIPKVYTAVLEGKVTVDDLNKLANGIEIEKGKVAYAEAVLLGIEKGKSHLEIVLYQGYNRQIRRMAEMIGHPVVTLKRTSHANVNLQGLERGQYKYLKPKEVNDLINYIKKAQKLAGKASKKGLNQ